MSRKKLDLSPYSVQDNVIVYRQNGAGFYDGIFLYGEVAKQFDLKDGDMINPEDYVHIMLENAAYGIACSRLKLKSESKKFRTNENRLSEDSTLWDVEYDE